MAVFADGEAFGFQVFVGFDDQIALRVDHGFDVFARVAAIVFFAFADDVHGLAELFISRAGVARKIETLADIAAEVGDVGFVLRHLIVDGFELVFCGGAAADGLRAAADPDFVAQAGDGTRFAVDDDAVRFHLRFRAVKSDGVCARSGGDGVARCDVACGGNIARCTVERDFSVAQRHFVGQFDGVVSAAVCMGFRGDKDIAVACRYGIFRGGGFFTSPMLAALLSVSPSLATLVMVLVLPPLFRPSEVRLTGDAPALLMVTPLPSVTVLPVVTLSNVGVEEKFSVTVSPLLAAVKLGGGRKRRSARRCRPSPGWLWPRRTNRRRNR